MIMTLQINYRINKIIFYEIIELTNEYNYEVINKLLLQTYSQGNRTVRISEALHNTLIESLND